MTSPNAPSAIPPVAPAGTKPLGAPKPKREGIRSWFARQPWFIRLPAIALFIVGAFYLPYIDDIPIIGPQIITANTDWSTALFSMTYYALLALGLNVVVGYAGMLDLGYVGFFAIGAYTVALLTATNGIKHWSWLAAAPFGLILATFSGVLLGWPTLRLRGDYLAIVTLAFAEIIHITADSSALLKGQNGFTFLPHPPGKNADGTPIFGLINGKPYYWLGLIVVIVVVLAIRNLDRSRVGRSWLAVREDEEVAEVMGVRTVKYKLWAFAIGAFVAGLSGVLWAGENIFVNSQTFVLQFSILVLAAVVLGGAGNMAGAILGGVLISYIPDRLTGITIGGKDGSVYKFLIFGFVILLVMWFRPQGLIPSRRRAAELKDRATEVAPQ
jgi:branched-chain amino acid transport system permease protein